MQVAVGIHMEDVDSVIETYNLLSEKWFTHATPTLFNAATPRPQMSSCFLVQMREDSIGAVVIARASDPHTADDVLSAVSAAVC